MDKRLIMPENLISTARDWWTLILTAIAAVVWFARLESRSKQNEKNLTDYKQVQKDQRKEDLAARQRDRDEMKMTLSVIQNDIKEILKRTGQ